MRQSPEAPRCYQPTNSGSRSREFRGPNTGLAVTRPLHCFAMFNILRVARRYLSVAALVATLGLCSITAFAQSFRNSPSSFPHSKATSRSMAGCCCCSPPILRKSRACRSTTLRIADGVWRDRGRAEARAGGHGGRIGMGLSRFAACATCPPGEYYVQALLQRTRPSTAPTARPSSCRMDQGEGQHWNLAPGNLYSKPVKITMRPAAARRSRSCSTRRFRRFPTPADTKYVRHIRIQSELLTKFWGRPMYLSRDRPGP